MSKIYIPLPKKEDLNLFFNYVDGFFIGIKDYSYGFNNIVDINELKEYIDLIKGSNKDIFIVFNRLYYNDEIEGLKALIKSIINLDITGIGFSDLGVLNILNELNYKGDILWYSNHIGTNSRTINFLNKRNVDLFLLSNEITKDEIIKIKNNSNGNIGCTLYGHLNMATSSRKLLTNYFSYINKSKEKDVYTIKDKVKDKDYIITEGFNTDFYTKDILNGIKYYPELKNIIDFIYLDDYMIDTKEFLNVLDSFKNNTVTDSEYTGFLEKKTVYKVEDYE
jgi:collagenase-like PrtC family protease